MNPNKRPAVVEVTFTDTGPFAKILKWKWNTNTASSPSDPTTTTTTTQSPVMNQEEEDFQHLNAMGRFVREVGALKTTDTVRAAAAAAAVAAAAAAAGEEP